MINFAMVGLEPATEPTVFSQLNYIATMDAIGEDLHLTWTTTALDGASIGSSCPYLISVYLFRHYRFEGVTMKTWQSCYHRFIKYCSMSFFASFSPSMSFPSRAWDTRANRTFCVTLFPSSMLSNRLRSRSK